MTDTSKPLFIFDLDGTIANIEHRRAILADKTNPKRWDQFYLACIGDTPNKPVVETLTRLRSAGCEIRVWSGRSDVVRRESEIWLTDNTPLAAGEVRDFKMRRNGDSQPDNELKNAWLETMAAADRARLVAVFDDRDKVVAMWRTRGVACFQVAPGNF